MNVARLFAAATVVAIVVACSKDEPQEGHIVFYIDTDAPLLPKPRGAPSDLRAPGLFDKLSVEFYAATDTQPCSSCLRDFPASEDLFTYGASLTVRGNVDRVRVRLYRSMDIVDGDIAPRTTIETVARLPPVPSQGSVAANVLLATAHVGKPQGTLSAPVQANEGSIVQGHVGTWAPAHRTFCTGAARDEEMCIPGGAYFMGSSRVGEGDYLSLKPRLIVLSPFYLDKHEVTIGAIADWVAKTKKDPTTFLLPWDKKEPPEEVDFCTYGRVDRDLPVNCIVRAAALEYCQSQGKTLPTDAQMEYVSSGMKADPYVWGRSPPQCSDAVWGVRPNNLTCQETSSTGPVAWTQSGWRKRDFLRISTGISTGTVYDLAGNVSEYVLDALSVDADPCWQVPEAGFLQNPLCTVDNTHPDPTFSADLLRGGNWNNEFRDAMRATERQALFYGPRQPAEPRRAAETVFATSDIGFRCARKP